MNTASKLILFVFTLLTLAASAYAQAEQGAPAPRPADIRAYTMEESGDEDMARGKYESALWSYSKWGGYSAGFADENAPDVQAYRERMVRKITAALAKMVEPPAIPENAEFHARKGAAFVKRAKTPADFAKAVREFQDAVNRAPWVFDYHYNLAVAYKLADQYKLALNSLDLAKLLAPSDKDRRDLSGLRGEIEAAQEMAVK